MSSSPECRVCGDYIHHGPVVCSKHDEKAAALDAAWEAINTLGGRRGDTEYSAGYVDAIAHALEEIERLGGMNPARRAPKPLHPMTATR